MIIETTTLKQLCWEAVSKLLVNDVPYVSSAFIQMWSTWEVSRAFKKLELLSASLWQLWGNFRALQTSHKVYLKPGDSFSSFDNALIKRTCRSNLNCLYIFVNAQIFNLLLAPMLFPTYKVLFLFCKRNYNSNVNLVTYVDDKCKGKHTLKREMKQLHSFVS